MTLTTCGTPLPDSIREALAALAEHRTYPYPWSELSGGVSLMGYGSLLNAASAARTLAPAPTRPVLAFGIRRVFEYDMGDVVHERYGESKDSIARAALNVRVTGVATDAANGLLFEIPASEIAALRKREYGYDLRPVVCLPWEQWHAAPFVAYVLSCPTGSPRVSDRVQPQPTYLQTCRDGAASVSKSFLAAFLASTYLGDGRSLIEDLNKTK